MDHDASSRRHGRGFHGGMNALHRQALGTLCLRRLTHAKVQGERWLRQADQDRIRQQGPPSLQQLNGQALFRPRQQQQAKGCR